MDVSVIRADPAKARSGRLGTPVDCSASFPLHSSLAYTICARRMLSAHASYLMALRYDLKASISLAHKLSLAPDHD
jgi:hypothetical protein